MANYQCHHVLCQTHMLHKSIHPDKHNTLSLYVTDKWHISVPLSNLTKQAYIDQNLPKPTFLHEIPNFLNINLTKQQSHKNTSGERLQPRRPGGIRSISGAMAGRGKNGARWTKWKGQINRFFSFRLAALSRWRHVYSRRVQKLEKGKIWRRQHLSLLMTV